MSYPRHVKQKFIELRAVGVSYDKISAVMGISKTTLLKWAAEFEKEIAAEEYIKAEALIEKHRLYRQARLEDAVEEFARIRAALKSRDLSKVNITALREMYNQNKDEIATMIADLRKYAGLNRDGEKRELTQAEIDELIEKTLGVPPPKFPAAEGKKENPDTTVKTNAGADKSLTESISAG